MSEYNEVLDVNGVPIRITIVDGTLNIHCISTETHYGSSIMITPVHAGLISMTFDKPMKKAEL